MKQTKLLMATGWAILFPLSAQAWTVCDFESHPIGDTFTLWNRYGSDIQSTATVEADPANPDNKVLHIVLKGEWNTYVEFQLPDELAGPKLTDKYATLEYKLYRPANDPVGEWKHFDIYYGTDALYEDDGWPSQGGTGMWMNKNYTLKAVPADNASTLLRIGFNSDNTDYYIDDVILKGKYDDYITIEEGILDLCTKNTSSTYASYTTPLFIPADKPLTVYTSRYTEFMPVIAGSGTLSMYCGGERTYAGAKDGASYPDWSEFTGDLHIYPYKEVEPSAGFYGLVLCDGGKTFNPEDVAGSLPRTNSQLINNKVYLHENATLANRQGVRGARIGELNTESGSRICGAFKTASTSGSYLVVGYSGSDATLAGQIAPIDKDGKPYSAQKVGLVKEGAGTYRITGNNNLITGAIRVLEGKILLNNDAEEARSSKLSGAVGALGSNTPGVYVFQGATIGGTGSVGSVIDLYGNLEPGDNGIGTLTLTDYAGNSEVALRLRPTSKLYFELASATEYDRIDISGAVDYYNIGQDFATSDKLPILYLIPGNQNEIQAGDEFTLISAKSKTAFNDIPWNFRIQYPKAYTWTVEERETETAYQLIARVTSLDYSGQGDTIIDDGEQGGGNDDDDDDDDGFDETTDPTPIRQYATRIGKHFGVAVPTWRINVDDDQVAETSIIAREFNMVVAENEMKFDAIEPARNSFNFAEGDRLINFAARHAIDVRGHTLAWHKQVPEWLTKDGNKNSHNFSRAELLSILENHIRAVVGHWKGKVKEWDVVNECLDDNQSAIRTDPDAYDLRPSVWYSGIGEDFIDSAFVYAHRADPDAKLYLNDYDVEFKGNAKTEALLNLAKRLKNSGIPIDGVGLQCHITTGDMDAAKFAATVESYAEIGLNCIITELDIALADPEAEDALERQAKDYAAIAKVATTHDNCPNMVIWGLADNYSWRQNKPLLYDNSLTAKPAYYSVHKVFRRAANDESELEKPTIDKAEATRVRYYDLQGRPIARPQAGITIQIMYHSDGTVSCRKQFVK